MNDRTNVNVLAAFYEPQMTGGAEKMVKEVVEQLGQKHDITMVTGLFDRKVPRQEKREHFNIVRVGIGHKKIDKILYPILAALMVRKLKPEIVHAIMESYAGMALVLVKYLAPKVKRILTLQSGDLDDNMKQSKWYIRLPWKWIHISPDLITAVSTFLAARAVRLGMPEERVIVTPNGLHLDVVPRGIAKVPGRVCTASRLSWEKGHQYLLRAWPGVKKAVPDANLVIVGEGAERGNIENLINELDIGESVTMVGFKPHPETLIEMTKANVFICPSLAEGLGNVFIEAQACGTPPVGTRVGGVPDVIQNEVNGLLIEPKNVEQAEAAMIRLLTDKEFARKMVINGLESSKKFDWPIILDQLDGIYRNILK